MVARGAAAVGLTRHSFCTRRLIPRLTNRFDKILDVAITRFGFCVLFINSFVVTMKKWSDYSFLFLY